MTSTRRALLAVTSIIVLLLTAFVGSGASSAASQSGELRIKGPGSLYSGDDSVVSEAVAAGTVDTFELLVVNKGTTLAQYNIQVTQSGVPATAELYSGTLLLSPLASGPDGYYTAPIASGKTQALTLKIKIPLGTPQSSATAAVRLFSTDGNVLSTVNARTEIKAPTYGTTAADLFLRQGAQPFIGGSVIGQLATAPAINVGGSAAFTFKLQNDGAVPAAVQGQAYVYADCATFVIKDGAVDVTAAFIAGTYVTPVLAVRTARTLTMTFKRTLSTGCGSIDYASVVGHNADNSAYNYAIAIAPYPAV